MAAIMTELMLCCQECLLAFVHERRKKIRIYLKLLVYEWPSVYKYMARNAKKEKDPDFNEIFRRQ